jgi:hypothetical protein
MHHIEILYKGDADKTKTVSEVIDARDFISMSLHIANLGHNTAYLYGSIIEPKYNKWIPVPINGSTSINSDGLYVLPPYYRYYRLNITRVTTAPVYAYMYMVKEGAWLSELSSSSSTSNGEFDKIRIGTQKDITVDTSLSTASTLLGSLNYTAAQSVYVSNMLLKLTGLGGAEIRLTSEYGATTVVLGEYALTGANPTINAPIPFLDKLDHTADGAIKIYGKKFHHRYDTDVFCRLIALIV